MYWFILFILLLLFTPFIHLSIAFLIIFIIINILLAVGEIVFRFAFRKKGTPSPHRRRRPPPTSSFGKDDDIEDAEFREEK